MGGVLVAQFLFFLAQVKRLAGLFRAQDLESLLVESVQSVHEIGVLVEIGQALVEALEQLFTLVEVFEAEALGQGNAADAQAETGTGALSATSALHHERVVRGAKITTLTRRPAAHVVEGHIRWYAFIDGQ